MDKVIRTQAPPSYISPHDGDITSVAKKIGLSVYSTDLVRDLANIAAGGSLLPPAAWSESVAMIATNTLPQPNHNGHWEIRDKDGYYMTTGDKPEAIRYRSQQLERYHHNVCDFLRDIDFTGVPGATPIEKSLVLLKMLSSRSSDHYMPEGMPAESDTLPIFFEKGQQQADEMNQVFEDINSLDDIENIIFEQDQQSNTGHSDDTLKRMTLAEDMLEGRHWWLKVSRQLDALSRMRVSRSKNFIADVEGTETRTRQIAHLNELSKLRPTEWTYPKTQQRLRIATRSAMMRERGKFEEKQQLLYILIDCSGSMQGIRIHKAGGVLMNRLRCVVSGDAAVYCRFFDTDLYPEHFAGNKEQAVSLIERFRNENFSGGGTRIAYCARQANQRIEELLNKHELLTRPELVIVTDGDDRCRELSPMEFHPTRVHAFIVGNTNKELVDFARATGGVGIAHL